jgi:hypothetical protein
MDLHCPHCGEQIVARSFGKCPACHRDLPQELKLSDKEKEMVELDEQQRDRFGPTLGEAASGASGIPTF